MKFALHYRGPLKPDGNAGHKFDLRRHFHAQLAGLWTQLPLRHMAIVRLPMGHADRARYNNVSHYRPRGGFNFVPIATIEQTWTGSVEVVLFRPGVPGQLVTKGDIDNRLKTLFDALAMPQEGGGIPKGEAPREGEDPFNCVFEDDAQITSVTVETEQLLAPDTDADPFHVELFLRIELSQTIRSLLTSAIP